MTGRENLRMVARLFGHDRRASRVAADAVLEQLGLTEDGDRLVRTYSGGMRRRLDLGASLVGAPRLLLLDEPTTGLDPRSRNELWLAIEELVDQGTDVLLTTQYLDEADRLADEIAIIDHGRLVAVGHRRRAQVARRPATSSTCACATPRDLERAAEALGAEATIDAERAPRRAARDRRRRRARRPRSRRSATPGVALDDIALRRPTLDDVFLALTGHTTDAPIPRRSPHERASSPPAPPAR